MALAGAERVFDLLDEAARGRRRLCHARQRRRRTKTAVITESDEPHRPLGVEAPAQGRRQRHRISRAEGRRASSIDVDFGYEPTISWCCTTSRSTPSRARRSPSSARPARARRPSPTSSTASTTLQDGKIRYDGININKIRKADLRRSLGIVLAGHAPLHRHGDGEHPLRPSGRDGRGVHRAPPSSPTRTDFITRLPDGYNTMLTGDGAQPLAGPAPAAGHRARGRRRPAGADSRRGDQLHRHPHRGARAGAAWTP